jgi:UDP-N-acetylglucosamine--N-acetylmuramyl-(pentapeptide) pyrophosphoryl-undecaprenol N-acetylglucosamine transferase
LIQLFEEKVEYIKKKENLANITNQNTWNNVNKKILEIFDES